MIYKLNKLGVYQPLLDAVNKVKSGENTTLTITYAYDQASFTGIESKTLNIDAFKTDILNSMFQWENFVSYVYSNRIHFDGNLTLKFKEVDLGSQDVVISFNSKINDISISKTAIKFNKKISWGTSEVPNTKDVMSYSVYAIGFLFGLDRVGGITPMGSKYLSKNFNLTNNISPTENGVVTTPVLHRYKKLFKHFKKIYGLLNTKTHVLYGCTDPNAINYNVHANTDNGSCVENKTIIPYTSSNYYTRTALRSTVENNTLNAHYNLMYDLSTNGSVYSYNTEGIVFNSNSNIDILSGTAISETLYTSICASITSLNNGILNVVSIVDWQSDNLMNRGYDVQITDRLNSRIWWSRVSLTGDGSNGANTDPYNISSKNSLIQILDSFDFYRSLKILFPGRAGGVEINLDLTSASNSSIDCVNSEDEMGVNVLSFIPGYSAWATELVPSLSASVIGAGASELYESAINTIQANTSMEQGSYPSTSVPTIFPFNDQSWLASLIPSSSLFPGNEIFTLGDVEAESNVNQYFNKSAAFMSGHLKKFVGSDNIQQSIPEIKVLTISPIQDSYMVQRYSGLADSSTTGTVIVKPTNLTWNDTTDIEILYNRAQDHFSYDSNINTIVYEFHSGYNFYDNTISGLSFGLQKASISPWTKNTIGGLIDCNFDGTLSAEEQSTLVVPLKIYPAGIGVLSGEEQDSVDLALEFSIAVLGAGSGGQSFDQNAIFVQQAIDNTFDSENDYMFRPSIANPAFSIDNKSFAFHKTNNYPLIISKKLRPLDSSGSAQIQSHPYTANVLGESLGDNSLFYSLAVQNQNVALGYKMVFIGMKYGIMITRIHNISGEFDSGLQKYIPAGDNLLLGYEDVDTFEGGFLMVDFASSLHDNFLYAIVEDPNTADRHIVVYDITDAYTANDETGILSKSKSIPNPLSADLSSVTLEKDGNIYFYSDNSSEYIKVSEPDTQVSVDILLNYASTLILEAPVESGGMNIKNSSSNIFDFLKFHHSEGYLTINDQSTEQEAVAYHSAYALDLLTEMQLNVTPDINPGQHLPIADQEKYRLLNDNLLFNINYGESGNFYEALNSIPVLDDLLSLVSVRIDYSKNNRIINLGNHIAGIIVFGNTVYNLYDREGGILATFDPTFELISVESIIDGPNVDYRLIATQIISNRARLGYYTLTFPVDETQASDTLNGISLGSIDTSAEGFSPMSTELFDFDDDSTIVSSFTTNTDNSNTTHLYFAHTVLQQGGVLLVINKHIINASGVTSENVLNSSFVNLIIQDEALVSSDFSTSILKIHGNTLVLSFNCTDSRNVIRAAFLIYNLATNVSELVFASQLDSLNITSLEIVGNNIFYICTDGNGVTTEFNFYNVSTSGYTSLSKLSQQLYTTSQTRESSEESYPSDFDLCTSNCDDNSFSTIVNYDPNSSTLSEITGLLKHPNGQIYISTSRAPIGGHYLSRILYPTTNSPLYALHIATVTIEDNTSSQARSEDPIDFKVIVGQSGGIIEDPDDVFDAPFFMPLFDCFLSGWEDWCGFNPFPDQNAISSGSLVHNNSFCGELPSAEAIAVCPNGGCQSGGGFSPANSNLAYTTIYACGTCTAEDFNGITEYYDLLECGVCPPLTPNAINQYSGCGTLSDEFGNELHNYQCQEDIRMCQFEGCDDRLNPSTPYGVTDPQLWGTALGLACNGFGINGANGLYSAQGQYLDAAEGGFYPDAEHSALLCFHPTGECQCDGAGGVEKKLIQDFDYSIIEGQDNNSYWVNCTDCTTQDPLNYYASINTFIVDSNYLTNFNNSLSAYNEDSYNQNNTVVPWPYLSHVENETFCTCDMFRQITIPASIGSDPEPLSISQIQGLWDNRNVCDCEGSLPADMPGLGPYCDCFGNYDTAKYCDCTTKKEDIGTYCNCDGTSVFTSETHKCYDEDGNLLCNDIPTYWYVDYDGDGKYTCSDPLWLCKYQVDAENQEVGYTKYIKTSDPHECDDCDGVEDCHGNCVPYLLNGTLSGPVAELDECGVCGGQGAIFTCPNSEGLEGCESFPPPIITVHPVTGAEITASCDCDGNIDYGCGSCGVSEMYDSWTGEWVPIPIHGGGTGFTEEGNYVGSCNVNMVWDYCGNIWNKSTSINDSNPKYIFNETTGHITTQRRLNLFNSGGSPNIYSCNCPVVTYDASGIPTVETIPGEELLTENECCPGYTYVACHGCRENSVAATLTSDLDCAGRCPEDDGYLGVYDPETNTVVSIGVDECGVCGGSGLNAFGCCGDKIKDCNDTCVDSEGAAVLDNCGVCGGNNTVFPDGTICAGCMDSNAYNYTPNLIIDDGSCAYFEVTNPDDYPVISIVESDSQPNFDGIIITHHSNVQVTTRPYSADNIYDGESLSLGLPLTLRKIYAFNEAGGAVAFDLNEVVTYHSVLRDNKTVTNRCQIISRNSPYLYLTNAAQYGEVAYTIDVDVHLNPTDTAYSANYGLDEDTITDALEPNVIGENTVATITERTAVFYFRVEADANNASPFEITPIIGSSGSELSYMFSYLLLAGIVVSVEKEDNPNIDTIEAGVVSDELITSTVDKFDWNTIYQAGVNNPVTPSTVIVSEGQPNYHVYKVVMGTTADGLPFDFATPIDFTPYFSDLSNTIVQKRVCGSCNSSTDGLPTGFEQLNPAGTSVEGTQHYSYYNLTAEQFIHLTYGNTILVDIEDPTTTTNGVVHEYIYDASACAAACIDMCVYIGDNVQWKCCDENAENYEGENLDGFFPSCQRCWTNDLDGPNPCTFPTPDPTPICCYPDYLEYWGNWGIDISVNPIDSDTGQPGNWLCDPSQCLTFLDGETENENYGDPDGNFTTTIQSLPNTNTDVEFFIFNKEGKILFDHNSILRKTGKSVKYNNLTFIQRVSRITNMDACAGFVPIAFKTNEDWLNLRLTISEAMNPIFGLDFGQMNSMFSVYSQMTTLSYGSSDDSPDGSAVLKVGQSDCYVGCDDQTIDLPEACVRKVARDVKEFTEFHVEIITEESPVAGYTEENTEFIVYNIETGEKIITLNALVEGTSITKSFRLTRSAPIGIKAVSPNMLIYKIIDEQGTVIKTKTIYNDSYFEPFKIHLATPGCTDATAANYDSNADLDDGSCLSAALYDCVKSALFDIDILQCDTRENTKSLQMYTIYQSYKEAVKEKNEVKIEMYGDKLTELCNCETC